MIPALALRLQARDPVCDCSAIYLEQQSILLRPTGMEQADWNTVCLHICGATPKVECLTFTLPENDPAVWLRLETYMKKYDNMVVALTSNEATFRRKPRK